MKIFLILVVALYILTNCGSADTTNSNTQDITTKDSIYVDSFFYSFIRLQKEKEAQYKIPTTNLGSISISELEIHDNVCINDVYGFTIKPKFTINSKFDVYAIHIKLFKNGIPISSNYKFYTQNHAGIKYINSQNQLQWYELITKQHATIFVPYNMLELSPGKQNIEAAIQITTSDKRHNELFPTNVGITKKAFEINQPKLKIITIAIPYLQVKPTKANGKKWDKINGPDLRFKIYLTKTWRGESIYRSSEFKNSFVAQWVQPSCIIYLDPRDWFCIYVVDYDPAADDTIASYYFTYSSFIKATQTNNWFVKDQIKQISVQYTEIAN